MKLLLFLLFIPLPLMGQHPAPLRLNHHPVSATLKKGEHRLYALDLVKDKTYIIRVEQKGIDVDLSLTTLTGQEIRYQDAPNGEFGPEIIEFKPGITASYLLKVQPLDDSANAEKGKYSIQVQEKPTGQNGMPIVTLLSPRQMNKDLKIFRSIREKANSGMYRYRTKQEIDSLYNWAHHQTGKSLNIIDFYKIILVLTDFEGSCHNRTDPPLDLIYYLPKDKGFFPYHLKYIENAMVVNNANKEIPLGSRIWSIDGLPDTSIMTAFYKYFPGDGYNLTQKRASGVNNSFGWRYPFEFGIKDSFLVTYSLPYSEKVLSKTIGSISLEEKARNYKERHSLPYDSLLDFDIQEKYSFKLLNPSTALLNLRIFTMADNAEDPAYAVFCSFLDSIFISMKHDTAIRHLVIDIRNNPGGNDPTYEKVFSYLTNTPFRENTLAYITFSKIPFAGYYLWESSDKQNQKREQAALEKYLNETFPAGKKGKFLQDPQFNPYWYPDSNRFKGEVFLLIDENVASAASHFASLVKGHTTAKIAGVECTGGYYGHNGHMPFTYELPNSKIKSWFSIVYVNQDAPEKASQPVGRGVIPDIEISQSFGDFMTNRDTQLNQVLKLIGNR